MKTYRRRGDPPPVELHPDPPKKVRRRVPTRPRPAPHPEPVSLLGDLDPDIALWPTTQVQRWPFTGPPTEGIWPKGWIGADNEATVWLCYEGGEPGSWVPFANAGGADVEGVYNVRGYGAMGDGQTDDTEAILAATEAAKDGGTVYFPPGTYNCSGQLQYRGKQIWQGVGPSSVINLVQDLGDDTALAVPFIYPDLPTIYQNSTASFRDLLILGPGRNWTVGINPCFTIGLQTSGSLVCENVSIMRFFAGFDQIADHEVYIRCEAHNNYYGLDFSDNLPAGFGNQSFYSCKFDGNALASIHVSTYNNINCATFHQTHLGYSPVGILRTDPQSPTTPWDAHNNPVYDPTQTAKTLNPGILASSLRDTSFEAYGNGTIIDISQGSQGQTFYFSQMEMLPRQAPAFLTTLAPLDNPQYQNEWAMWLRGSDTSSVIYCTPIPMGTVGGIYCSTTTGPTIRHSQGIPASALGSGTTWTVATAGRQRFISENSGGVLTNPGQAFGESLIFPTNANVTINTGDLVEVANQTIVQRATGAKPCFGTALTPAPASTVAMKVQVLRDGYAVLNTTGGAITAGLPLYMNAATPYLVDQTSITMPVVGMAVQDVVSGSTVQALVTLSSVGQLQTSILDIFRSSPLGYRSLVIASGPVGYWPLDADANDQIGTHNGTVNGGVTFGADGPWGANGAASFDGTTGYVSVPYASALNPPDAFSVEAWALTNTITSGTGTIIGARSASANGVMLWRSAAIVALNMAAAALTVPNGFVAGAWTHFVVAYAAGQLRLYMNGTQRAATAGTPLVNPSGPLTIGRQPETSTGFWNGLISHAAVYDRALSPTEIAAHYAMAPP